VLLVRTAALAHSVSADAQVRVAFAGASRAPLAGRLVVAGADPGPAGGVAVGGQPVHVGAELGDDHLAVAGREAGDRAQKLSLARERERVSVLPCKLTI